MNFSVVFRSHWQPKLIRNHFISMTSNNTPVDNCGNNRNSLAESLSALMDGESTGLEARRLTKNNDPELLDRWHRYHLGSAILRGELRGSVDIRLAKDIAPGVAKAIGSEPDLSGKHGSSGAKASADKSSGIPNFWSHTARLGIAASVAGALIVGIQLAPVENTTIATAPPTQSAPVFTQSLLTTDASARVVSQDNSLATPKEQKQTIIVNEATRRQLDQMKSEANRLMLEHARNASQHTRQGVLPYVRVPESG